MAGTFPLRNVEGKITTYVGMNHHEGPFWTSEFGGGSCSPTTLGVVPYSMFGLIKGSHEHGMAIGAKTAKMILHPGKVTHGQNWGPFTGILDQPPTSKFRIL